MLAVEFAMALIRNRHGRCSSRAISNQWAVLCLAILSFCSNVVVSQPIELDSTARGALLRILEVLEVYKYSGEHDGQTQHLPWDPGADPCASGWIGVQCLCTEGEAQCNVLSLNLSATTVGLEYILYGYLPDVFSQLPKLEAIDLSNQQLSGTLPRSILSHVTLKTAFLQHNLFVGGILDADVSLSTSLEVLDVSFNMLAGPIDDRLCSLDSLTLLSNPSLCGSVPSCLSRKIQGGAPATGLMRSLGLGRECSVQTAWCTELPLALPQPIRESVGISDGTHCTTHVEGSVLGSNEFNITFSPLESVDALSLSFSGVGSTDFDGWFWMTSNMHSLVKTIDAPPPQVNPTTRSCQYAPARSDSSTCHAK